MSADQQAATKDYAIISLHEKGFWQIDVYWGMDRHPEEGDVPDHFKTCKIGGSVDEAIQWARDWYMHAKVVVLDDEDDDDRAYEDAEGQRPEDEP